jgi:poly(A) polymerase
MDGRQESDNIKVIPEVRTLLGNLRRYFAEQDIEVYLVGGFIRDMLLGRDTADIDFCVSADGMKVASDVADVLGGKYVPLDEENGTGRVVVTGGKKLKSGDPVLDFTTIQGSIEQDLARRDFKIDAMALNFVESGEVLSGAIIDPFNGKGDLKEGVIRAVGADTFKSDAVRLLRAVRLAAELEFTIDEKTNTLIKDSAGLITGVAGERVREELLKLLSVRNAGRYVTFLDELGLLTGLIPELENTKGVEQPPEHNWDVFTHTLMTVSAVDFVLGEGDWEYADEKATAAIPWRSELDEHFKEEVSSGSNRKTMLRMAALLHDIGKPDTKAFDNGRMRFLGHSKEGAAVIPAILERLRFSSKEIKLVVAEVEHHMRPTQMSQEGLPTDRAIYRYFRDTGEAGLDILFLSLADHLATRGPALNYENWVEHSGLVEYVIGKHFDRKNIVRPPKIIDGYDIMNIFGVGPGPEVGELLEAVREAQASGDVNTRDEAIEFIKKYLASSRHDKTENSRREKKR